ncbi:MAG TPA: hypothetical protein PLD57_06400 [Aggregatilineales bacterium]|nr:hypothetical protein [Aggregatilineales bacterium]
MNLTSRNLHLDLLLEAGIDGLEIVEATQPARSIRAAELQQAGLRIEDEDGATVAALGAEFAPDQSGQLLVLVLSSGDEPGLSRPLAEAALAGAIGEPAVEALGSGVLRFDRALTGTDATPEVFDWLARAVVRLLTADAGSLSGEALAALLEVPYEPPLPAAGPEPEPEPVQIFEPPAPEPEPEPELEPEPEPQPEVAEPVDEEPEEEQGGRWRLFDGLWAEAEEEEEPEPELDEAQRELFRLLMGDVEPEDMPTVMPEQGPPAPEQRPLDELQAIAREEIGDEAAEMLTEDDLRMLVEALRGEGAEGPRVEVYGGAKEPSPDAQSHETDEPVEDGTSDADWLEDYEAVIQGEPVRAADEWLEAPSPAGPMPLRDMARHPEPPVEEEPEVAPPAQPDTDRYEYPPPSRVRSDEGSPRTYYLCLECNRYSAVQAGPGKYECVECGYVIEYRNTSPPREPAEWRNQPEP